MKLKEAANSNLWIILKIFFTCICKMNKINKMNFCWIKCQQLLDINTRIELKHDAEEKIGSVQMVWIVVIIKKRNW